MHPRTPVLIDRIAALVPPPRVHRHRYHGVLAPNSPLRDQVTALVREVAADATRDAQASDADQTDADEQVLRSPARYLWATLIARLFEQFPLTCRYCGADMKIIAFVIETPSVRAILEHIGEPARPPVISSARPGAALSCSAWAPAQTILVWSFAAPTQLTRRLGKTFRSRSISATIHSPNPNRRSNSTNAFSGDRCCRRRARSAAQSIPARFPPR